MSDDVGHGIQKIDKTTFRVDRHLVDAILEEQVDRRRDESLIFPDSEKGRVVGFRLFGVRSDSLLARLGLQNGDRVESVNGFAMTTPEKVLEAYAHLRTSNRWSVLVTRRGSRLQLQYQVL